MCRTRVPVWVDFATPNEALIRRGALDECTVTHHRAEARPFQSIHFDVGRGKIVNHQPRCPLLRSSVFPLPVGFECEVLDDSVIRIVVRDDAVMTRC